MRIEALDVNGYPAIQAAASVAGKNPALDDEQDAEQMGSTGRTFPTCKTSRAQFISKTGGAKSNKIKQGNILDLHQIVQLINLGANKFKILNLLQRRDLLKILRLLPQNLLVNALRLFSKEKLMRMMLHLPRKLVLKIMLSLFKIDKLVKRMPTSQLMRILLSPHMDNRKLAKGILNMEPRFLQMLMSRIFGGNQDFTKLKPREIFKLLMNVDRERITENLKTMPFKALQPMVANFIKKEPELLFNLSESFVSKMFSSIPKPYLIQACSILPPEFLLAMLDQLPNPMLVLAAAQIDDKSLEDFLVSQHGDLLQMLAGVA